MSQQENSSDTAGNIAAAEASLGKALAAIHRALAHIDELGRAADVQSQMRRAISSIDSALNAYTRGTGVASTTSQGAVAPEVVAAIAAAISTVLTGPYRLVSVQKVVVPVAQQNPWAVEGRAQIFRSHKIR